MMRLELSCYIEGDLDGIADYIAQDNPHRAVTFIQDIFMFSSLTGILNYPKSASKTTAATSPCPDSFPPRR